MASTAPSPNFMKKFGMSAATDKTSPMSSMRKKKKKKKPTTVKASSMFKNLQDTDEDGM
jgi:hypothetical protein